MPSSPIQSTDLAICLDIPDIILQFVFWSWMLLEVSRFAFISISICRYGKQIMGIKISVVFGQGRLDDSYQRTNWNLGRKRNCVDSKRIYISVCCIWWLKITEFSLEVKINFYIYFLQKHILLIHTGCFIINWTNLFKRINDTGGIIIFS